MIDFLDALKLDFESHQFGKRFGIERHANVVADEFKVRIFQQVIDVRFLARDEIVQADDARLLRFEQRFAQMRSDESGAAGHEDIFLFKNDVGHS
jgi:hypothetical protein